MYKYLIKKNGHTLTGFNDELDAKNYALQHNAQVVENTVKKS